MKEIQNFKKLLSKGLHRHNLIALEKFCNIKIKSFEENIFAWYILEDIFHQLQVMWDECEPITTTEYDRITSVLLEPINNLVESLLSERKETDITKQLNAIIKIYLELRQTFRQ